ncbi:hypothetical protein ACFY64_31400 [Streptomyces collinus]|uniref:hypothetical protein n=1 Tax=Streptomyces collinus TaxID=42684 RepID=UPI0036A8BABA
MQRPSSQSTTVAVVGVSTLGGGAGLAASDGDLASAHGLALPLACLAAATAGVVRRYIAHQERRVRELFTGLAREHAERERKLDRREADLDEREEALERSLSLAELRVANVHARMDIMLDERAEDRLAYTELQNEYMQLAHEYNEVLLESAGERPEEQAHQSPVAVGQTTSAGNSGPRPIPGRRGPRPLLSVIDGQRDHQESV